MSQEKVKISLEEALRLIQYLKERPPLERVDYNVLMEDLNKIGISNYTSLYMTKYQSIEVDKQQVFLFRLKYGL